MAISQAQVRQLALSLPEAEESSHHGRPDLRVRGKIFATLPRDSESVNMKIAPENLRSLTDREPDTYSRVWGERWVGVSLEHVDAADVQLLLEDAWRLTAPKRLVREFDGS